MLVDFGTCVVISILMLARALNYLCTDVRLSPAPVDNPFVHVNVANGSSMSMLGTLNVLFWFSGKNVKANSCKGPVMEYWYPTSAAIFANQSPPFILSA